MQMEVSAKDPLVITRADGVWLEDINGRRILDGAGCTRGVTVIGHGNRRVIKAITDQLVKVAYTPALESTNLPALGLTRLIGEITPGDLNTVMLFNAGSEATEAVMKLARQYHRQTGNIS